MEVRGNDRWEKKDRKENDGRERGNDWGEETGKRRE